MGQKVHPTGIRLGIVKEHTSVWYADGATYADYLLKDLQTREYLQDKLKSASVSRIDIHRPAQTARITIHTARPGIVIGKKGEDVEAASGPDQADGCACASTSKRSASRNSTPCWLLRA